MKVKRYRYGTNNVELLESQRRSAITPAEGAQAAAAPYKAVSDAAGAISDDLFQLQERKNKIQDENDKMRATTNIANTSTDLKMLRTQANQEQWTQEQFESAAEARIEEMVSNVDEISSRNQERHGFLYGAQAQRLLAETQLEGVDINTDRTREAFSASYAKLGVTENYDAQLAMLQAAGDSPGIKLFEPQVLEQKKREVEGNITAKALMVDYREARINGTGDEFLLKVSGMELTDEAQGAFNGQKAQHDALTKTLADKVRQEKGLAISKYYHFGITQSTTPDDVTAFIRNNDIIDEGTMSKLYGRMRAIKEDESVINSNDYNPASASDRKAFDALLPKGPNISEREMFEASMGIAIQRNIAPQWLDGYFNRGGYNTDNPQEYAQVAEDYHTYALITDRVPVSITEQTRAGFEMYHDLRQANTDSAVSAGLVLTKQKATTEDAFEANISAYDAPEFGTVEDVSPQETINTLLQEKIEDDFATRMGLNLNEPGLFGGTDKIPPIPPELRREMNRVSRNMWGFTTNEEVAANAAFGALRASGWMATDANEGVPAPGGGQMGFQYMKNPPSKPFAFTRAVMAQDIEGIQFQIPGEYKEGTARFNWRTVDPIEIQLGEGQIYTNEAKEQKMHWPMLINGEQLLTRKDGETTLSFFEYGEVPRINEDEFKVIEEAHKRATAEGRKRAIQIDAGLDF